MNRRRGSGGSGEGHRVAATRAPQLVVLPRADAERYEPAGREICISISDPGAEPAAISDGFAAVLRLYFDDVTEAGAPTDILFAPEHASEITKFVGEWPGVERVIVHCNMGVSRSPGVALGLCDLHGWAAAHIERSHPGWNRLVRAVMNASAAAAKKTRAR